MFFCAEVTFRGLRLVVSQVNNECFCLPFEQECTQARTRTYTQELAFFFFSLCLLTVLTNQSNEASLLAAISPEDSERRHQYLARSL